MGRVMKLDLFLRKIFGKEYLWELENGKEWMEGGRKRGEASRAAGYRSPHSHRSYCNLTLQTPIHHVQHNQFSTIFEMADGFLSA